MRRPIIAGNHKMNLLPSQGAKFIKELISQMDNEHPEVIIFPPYTSIVAMKNEIDQKAVEIGAQNIYYEESGAYTGEVAANMVFELGCTWVLCGHSERREIFKEDSHMVNKKIKAAIRNNLKPMLCVGESLEQREQNQTKEVLEEQLKESLKYLSSQELKDLVVAYEPVWAIGTGKTATPQDAQAGVAFIREKLSEIYGESMAKKVRILYGGSVNPENVKNLMSQNDIDGALIGGASLKVDSFIKLVKYHE